MHVLFMSHAYVPHTGAGAETTAHDLLRPAVDVGHTVDVLLSENRGPAQPYEVDGVHVHPYVDTGDPYQWIGTERHPDVLVSQLQNVNRAAALARVHGIPLVQVIHNENIHTKHALRVGPADLVVYNTEWVRRSCEEWLLFAADVVPPARALVVHPPIRREEYALPDGPGDHITMINLASVKGPETFYEMARRFPARRFLGVVGSYGDQLIMDLPNVEIIGHVRPKEMAQRVYARTKVLLVPSRYETYGRVSIEACVGGIPVIASDSPGLPEALGPEGTCLDREDYDAWEAELRRVLSPRGWSAASKRSKAVSDRLTTEADLARWVKELEAVAKVRVRV